MLNCINRFKVEIYTLLPEHELEKKRKKGKCSKQK